ncbi:MAG: DUF302 domain-containing protein [Candidatus Omnitrophica bacterium]|nr:DUF302 domain-containing protein [Candidatus Omnitrophota bacterium]
MGGIILALFLLVPGLMLNIHESRYLTVEETCQKLQAAIVENGWTSPAIRNMNEAMAKNGVTLERQVRVVELCKGAYAKDILSQNPELSTMMPCAFGVYEGNNKKIYISGMNTGFMGKFFGGYVARIMGGLVAGDEKRILKSVLRD